MQIAMSRTREQFPLSRKKILKKMLGTIVVSSIAVLAAIAIFTLVTLSGRAEQGGVGAVFVLMIIVILFFGSITLAQYLYQRWYFATYFYDLGPDYVVIRKGPITPQEITIPYERIQDVYVDQDLFDRILGIYDVHISSATIASGMQAHIDGVEKAAADGLKTLLLTSVSEKINRNRTPKPGVPLPPQ